MPCRGLCLCIVILFCLVAPASAQTPGPLKQIAMLGDSSFRHRAWLTSIEPFDGGKQVATTSRDGTIRIWDAAQYLAWVKQLGDDRFEKR